MIWLDAHLSPRVAVWVQNTLGVDAKPLRELGLRDADDGEIFQKGRLENVVILTKDRDFTELVGRLGTPPSVIWLRCGNTSEESLKEILSKHPQEALLFIENGESVVEIQ